ncbi:MAG: glycosyl transferase group 1 [Solirubrobacterales bacterium]|nr:glycosyl transferase group 1 [Solirubrobacterales bacterium]
MPHAPAPPSAPLRALEVWCDRFPSVSETFVAGEARELAALGHPVHICAAARGEGTDATGLPSSYLWEASPAARVRAMVVVGVRHPWRCLADLRDRRRWRSDEAVPPLRTLAPAIRRLRRSDAIVHAHFATAPGLRALRASRILGRPWSLTAHAYDIYRSPANLTEKLRSAALVTSGCAYTVADLRAAAGPQATHIHEIVMGVDPERFRRSGRPPGGRHVVAVGRLVEKKGFVHLIRALTQPALADATLTIVGDGPLAADLHAEVTRGDLTGRVTFAGALDPAGVRAQLEHADVLAMPCVIARDGDRDSMPVVVKEALAMELPVVVSDAVGLPELVHEDFGRIVPAGDAAALARGLAEVLAGDPGRRAAMGAAGRARVIAHANVRTETARLSVLLDGLGRSGAPGHPATSDRPSD